MESADPRTSSQRRRDLAPTLESVGTARDFVVDVLDDLAPTPIASSLVADVQLAVSELVTNAVIHGAAPIVLQIELTDSEMICTVTSSVAGQLATPATELAPPSASVRSGRGLLIVDAVADAVQFDTDGSTWSVTCTFHVR